jgi:diguanylate cyclase (GGDEF)-like protein
MDDQTIGVVAGEGDLVRTLRNTFPERKFVEAPACHSCAILIVDRAAAASQKPCEELYQVCIVLYDTAPVEAHGPREIRISRAAFLATPADFLNMADEFSLALIHSAQLEHEVSYLTQIQELMAMVEAEAVSERITLTVLNLLGVPHGALLLHDPRHERYVVSFSNDPTCQETGEFLPGIPPELLQTALSSGELFGFDAASGLMVMPLRVRDDLVGVIRVSVAPGQQIPAAATTNVTRYLRAVVQVLGNIYQLTRSRDLAMRDDLTKAFNRRFFESYLDEEIERSRRYGSLFSIIFLDLDDLKTVNNFYGHLTGSRTLQEVAKRILGAVRGIDKVVRFGGDEFCIILPQTDQDQAVAVANRIRKALVAGPFHVEPKIAVSITASFGIATYPTHAITKEDLIRQADAAMYRVKSTTKNAVGISSAEDVRARS